MTPGNGANCCTYSKTWSGFFSTTFARAAMTLFISSKKTGNLSVFDGAPVVTTSDSEEAEVDMVEAAAADMQIKLMKRILIILLNVMWLNKNKNIRY